MSSITVHCVVKNEQNWVWFAANSILDIADKVLIYDTGSEDKTVQVIKSIKSPKIILESRNIKNAKDLVMLRQEQLKKTETKWFMNLDGDEIWSQAAKKELMKKLKDAKETDLAVVIRAWNFVGDVYHYHPESIKYHWPFAPKDYLGWANMRVIKTFIPELHLEGKYPLEAYCDVTGTPIQNYGPNKLIFLKNRYFHTTYLQRSDSPKKDKKTLNRKKKNKYELGYKFPPGFKYPEIFYKKRPGIVRSPWQKRGLVNASISFIQTPAKEIRRRALNLYEPH